MRKEAYVVVRTHIDMMVIMQNTLHSYPVVFHTPHTLGVLQTLHTPCTPCTPHPYPLKPLPLLRGKGLRG